MQSVGLSTARKAVYYNVTLKRVRITIVPVEKQWAGVLYVTSVSVALVIQHAKRMRRIMLSSVAWGLAVPYFSALSQTARISEKSYGT